MIICRNCANEVDENEIFCNYCSHSLEESFADSEGASINKIQYFSNNKRNFAAILAISTVIVCFCMPIVRNYRLNHDIGAFEQSFNNKQYTTATQIYNRDKNDKKFSEQIRKYISDRLLHTKTKKAMALEIKLITGNSYK